ncbi:MAG TPA: beta-ketoacyl-ACP synthase III [Rickettsiales bacterium]|nr:beta-ketoacyl-ACP synthase III [Rickettsiales bacterium]
MISVIKGYGSYLPERIVTNDELAQRLDTNDAWITERTGIKQRHIAADTEMTSHLGAEAARRALKQAGLAANDIDLVLVATSTPDSTLPSTATKIQHQLGMTRGAAFDLNAACSGFVYALMTADSFIRSGQAKRVLVIGAEIFSRIVDWQDRSTCILFGDGAGAFILEASPAPEGSGGVLFARIYSDGAYEGILHSTGGVSSTQNAGTVAMNGKEVFRHAVAKMSEAVEEGLTALKINASDVDWVIPHQANVRILQSVAKKLNIQEDKLISTVSIHANTSAASIPLAACQAVAEGKIKPGQMLVLPALGAGLTWGACIIRW